MAVADTPGAPVPGSTLPGARPRSVLAPRRRPVKISRVLCVFVRFRRGGSGWRERAGQKYELRFPRRAFDARDDDSVTVAGCGVLIV